MKLQAIWFRTPVRMKKGRLLNSVSTENRDQARFVIEADYKTRVVSITDPEDDVPYEVPFENVVHFRRKKQAIVMDRVRNAARKAKEQD